MEQSVQATVRDETFIKLKYAVQIFQSSRLNTTYADLKSNKEYTKIGKFFFEKLYAPKDFSFRDASIKTLHKMLDGKVHKGMSSAVTLVIELHELSDSLDNLMVHKMIENGIESEITIDQYQEAYRQLNNYDQRIYQIKLVIRVTEAFFRLSQKWIVGLSLKTVKTAAHLIGMGAIMDFIYEGYQAFQNITNIQYFLDTIEHRELAWHKKIWEQSSTKRSNP